MTYIAHHAPVTVVKTWRTLSLLLVDTGHGMDRETLRRGTLFYMIKPVGRGTGPTLATVYGSVKQAAGFAAGRKPKGIGTVHVAPEIKTNQPIMAETGA